ncbi:hypothetical protein HZB94_02615 [Candidatus Falkowbacteria bacterium]|nr:hypothetical protein [Candidatus Falkowbacteria bacterium]
MDELKSLISRNLRETEEVKAAVKKIQRYVLWQQIFSWIKLVIIVVPIVLAVIYGMPLFKQAISAYQGLMGKVDAIKGVNNGPAGIMKIFEELEKGGLKNGTLNEAEIEKFLK